MGYSLYHVYIKLPIEVPLRGGDRERALNTTPDTEIHHQSTIPSEVIDLVQNALNLKASNIEIRKEYVS